MTIDTENTAEPADRLKDTPINEQLLADEILAARSAWFFHGICARGTRFPDGSVSKDSGADVTAAGSAKNQIRYADTALSYSPKVPLLYYACHILYAARLGDSDRKPIVLSRVPSEISGIDEVVINGTGGTMDTRSTGVGYYLIQRINSESTRKLFDKIKTATGFFERFYQAAFPGLDSAKDSYNGLYRLLTDQLILLEPSRLEIFAKAHPAELSWRNDGTFKNPRFHEQEALGLLNQSLNIKLETPIGVGTVQDFLNIKARIRETERG